MNRIQTIRMDGSVSDYEYFNPETTAKDSPSHWPMPILHLEENASLHSTLCYQDELFSRESSQDSLRLFLRMLFIEYYRSPVLFTSMALLFGGLLGFLLARWFYSNQNDPIACVSESVATFKEDAGGSTSAEIPLGCPTKEPNARLPRHIAIVMDGNRRYGRVNNCNGHAAGARQLGNVLEWTLEMPCVNELTLFCFSTQNWERDESEVNYLFQTLLKDYIEQQLQDKVIQRCIKVMVHSTDHDRIPPNVQTQLQSLIDSTAHFGTEGHPEMKLKLNLCISYGGREEILAACQGLIEEQRKTPVQRVITEDDFARKLCVTSNPDLLIRTAGDVRLSNFLLWQTSYTELCFVEETWPDVSKERYQTIVLEEYPKRQRRFGK